MKINITQVAIALLTGSILTILVIFVVFKNFQSPKPTLQTNSNQDSNSNPTSIMPSPQKGKKKVDDRPIGSLPYNYISSLMLGNDWYERGISLRKNTLRQLSSSDNCTDIYISDLGPLTSDLEPFTANLYQIPSIPINKEALYKTQYRIGNYPSISVGPMGVGEVSNTVVEIDGRAIGINVVLNSKSDTSTSCTFPEEHAREVIESIRFQSNAQEATAGWQKHTIPDAQLTFSAPTELEVSSETQKNDSGKADSLTLFVQKGTGGQADYYQLYGLYQWNVTYTKDSLKAFKEELNPESIHDTTISGYPALQGQIKGQRNRFVTYILTDKGMFSLFTAEPTEQNKKLTDQILATFQFTK